MKRKLAVMMLAASVVLSNVTPAMTMTVHAEEAQDDGSGDNEAAPQDEGGNEDAGSNDSAPADEGGSSDSGSSDSGSSSGNDNSSSDSGSNDSGNSSGNAYDQPGDDPIRDILDEVFGGNHWNGQEGGSAHVGSDKPTNWDDCNKPLPSNPYEDNNTTTTPESKPGNTENSGSQNTGSSNTGNTDNTQTGNTGSSNTDNTGNSTNAGSSTTTTVTDPVTNTVTTTVTDPAVLAVLPEAMVVATTEGGAYIHSLEATRTMYIGWKDGLPECWFQLLKADGTQAAMLDVTPVTDPAMGRLYVNVTIDPADGAVEVFGPIEGMVSFTRHMGLDGVMVNGVLIKDFTAVEASVQ